MSDRKKKRSKLKFISSSTGNNANMLCDSISFAATEAYKLLRTNIMFSFPGESACRVIGITSALRGEGKSVTAINTAFSLAQFEKRVLLIEGDLRIPSISHKLTLASKPGLSNLLVGLDKVEATIQKYVSDSSKTAFDVIVAGDIPPNPSEILGSGGMKSLVDRCSEEYDFIIVDLPPIISVSDALVMSKFLDGMLVVVRQDYCQRGLLAEVVKQLAFVNCRMLGFVYNCATDSASGYGSRYSRRYNKYYSKRYGNYYKKHYGQANSPYTYEQTKR